MDNLLLHYQTKTNTLTQKFNVMTTTQSQIKDILKSKGYSVSVDSRVWMLDKCGFWQEVRTITEAENLDQKNY